MLAVELSECQRDDLNTIHYQETDAQICNHQAAAQSSRRPIQLQTPTFDKNYIFAELSLSLGLSVSVDMIMVLIHRLSCD